MYFTNILYFTFSIIRAISFDTKIMYVYFYFSLLQRIYYRKKTISISNTHTSKDLV
jgi:hypothetical protein